MDKYEEAAQWAENDMVISNSEHALRGEEAAAFGRATLKHAREGFEAALNGWCDEGDHVIREGEMIIQSPDREGYVHVNCL